MVNMPINFGNRLHKRNVMEMDPMSELLYYNGNRKFETKQAHTNDKDLANIECKRHIFII